MLRKFGILSQARNDGASINALGESLDSYLICYIGFEQMRKAIELIFERDLIDSINSTHFGPFSETTYKPSDPRFTFASPKTRALISFL